MAGAIAGIAEALSTSNDEDVPAEDVRKGLEPEPGPPKGHYGLVLKPPGVDALLPPDAAHPEDNETAVTIRDWLGTDQEKLVDRPRQIWWPSDSSRRG